MLLMVAFAALWALVEAIAAYVLRRYSPYQVVWTRYAVHVALMLALWGWREPASLWRTPRPVFQLARSMLMLGMPASWVIGQQMGLDSATLMAVFWVSPLLIIALAAAFGGERVPAGVWIAGIVGYAGALLLHPPAGWPPWPLLGFAVAMALCFSAYVVMTRSLRSEPTRVNLFYTAFGVLVALTPAMPVVWTMPNAVDLMVMVAIGVLGYFCLYFLDRMAHAAPVSIPASFAYVQLAIFLGMGTVTGGFGGHSPRREIAGLVLVGAACLYLWAREARPRITDTPVGVVR
jgi:drug/metabolite transporter (DMT)-like permease